MTTDLLPAFQHTDLGLPPDTMTKASSKLNPKASSLHKQAFESHHHTSYPVADGNGPTPSQPKHRNKQKFYPHQGLRLG